ncbi:hypothetical protein BpHYR1_029753 [Brachionus plicatilis]|uniref:Uncharacterized protein n=1 Tax=Brachionus plicatilis TaxID=10195 RepID=A0A3M7PGF7_BRAPC|nr:hypothetical protein BpHYR1_029753 [Brachionus plicatilis]
MSFFGLGHARIEAKMPFFCSERKFIFIRLIELYGIADGFLLQNRYLFECLKELFSFDEKFSNDGEYFQIAN